MSLLTKAIGIKGYLITGGVALAIGFGAAWWLQSDRVKGVKMQLSAMTSMKDMAAKDAARWEAFANVANTANDLHNAEAEKARADLAKTEAILDTADEVARAEAAELNSEIAKWKARANEHPDQTRELGPIARDAVRVLVQP